MTIYSDDTICALSTAIGGAMATIRISGSDALPIAAGLFHNASGKSLSSYKSHTAHYGEILDDEGHVVDDVVALVMHAPHSYTGEDSVEISCHGSSYIISQLLHLLISHGCRQARPGEFTQRAFLNGKMDLSQAEAVADLISATNRATHQMALSQLRGHFSHELSTLRDRLLHLTSLMELELDFSDHEDLEFADRSELLSLTHETERHISRLAESFATGKALRDGIAVTIVGKTNVGKSTLLNRLLHDDKAIVSDIHGTTRDVIEDTTLINGVCYRFIDTAGLRQTTDTIERLGIERTYRKVEEASIVIWMTDCPPTAEEAREMLSLAKDKKLIAVVNKIDKTTEAYSPLELADSDMASLAEDIPVVHISAKHNINIDILEEAIHKASGIPSITQNDVIVTNARHYEALTKALSDIRAVAAGMENGLSGDLLSEDLRSCITNLSEIVGGSISTDETLANIFSHFCVGK